MPTTAPEAHPVTTPAQTTLVLRVLTVATFVVILNETIMNNAIPRLMADFDVPATSAQWLTTAFMLTMAVVIPMTGWIMQRLAVRRTFALAMGLFAVGTTLAALAPTFEILVAARVVQASGTAVMIPLLMTTLMNLVPVSDRGRTMGNVSLVIAVAPAMGPAVSGLLLRLGSWRLIFLTVLPIALVALWVGLRHLPDVGEREHSTLDLLSVVLSVIGFGGMVYGLSGIGGGAPGEGGPAPEPVVDPLVAVGVAAVAIAAFAWRQRSLVRSGDPLMDLRTLRFRSFTGSFLTMCLAFAALISSLILLPIHLQDGLGLTTLEAGLLLIPGGLAMGLLGPTVGRLYDRLGARPLILPGSIGMTFSLALMALLVPTSGPWTILVLHVLLSLSLALLLTPLFTAGLGALPQHLYAHGSALLGSSQQVFGAAGTATSIAVLALVAGPDPTAADLARGAQGGFALLTGLAAISIVTCLTVSTPPVEDGATEPAPTEGAATH
ncbi:DHA2 family efflux MFS transporter permease subunit [Janibacter cremeus]|uniref:DHA2 family lincomycin resistance protein-like MFS transporter n=1 Tax=Janibacter cremeus TaxID=1285192 RepID=A0A852VQ37_9MICO|nr:DHA2 family efflux MFS transporter permease subunit [Janibacter cremeus]NYF98306.1 DHA2 family lincomycin resistance protein-like MFS transporter [Janibacter cremeus]